MMEDIHIADGIAAKLLLAGIVLAGGAVGALALAPASSQAAAGGAADEPFTAAFPIPNVTDGAGTLQLSLDGKGNDPYPTAAAPIDGASAAFPINNVSAAAPLGDVTVSGGHWDVKDTDPAVSRAFGSTTVESRVLAHVEAPDGLSQDMDPY